MARRPLGRRPPRDRVHETRFPLRLASVTTVEKVHPLPYWHWSHDQGYEGSCVGHAAAMERAVVNTMQNRLLRLPTPWTRRYDPIDIWNEAKKRDEWPETNPGDGEGTSVRAAYDMLRTDGPWRVRGMSLVNGVPTPSRPYRGRLLADGIVANRWATSIEEMRSALKVGPVVIGVNWHVAFDEPEQVGTEWWIGRGFLGGSRGGHAVCVYGASDRRQAFRIKNSWGREYPLVWLPYTAMEALLAEGGEACMVTDR